MMRSSVTFARLATRRKRLWGIRSFSWPTVYSSRGLVQSASPSCHSVDEGTRCARAPLVEVVPLPQGTTIVEDASYIPIGYGACTHALKVRDPQAFDDMVLRTIEQLRASPPSSPSSHPLHSEGPQDKTRSVVSLRRLRYGVLGLLVLYFVTVVNLIFVVFDWNLIEPTTFFIGQFVVLWGICHHYRYLGTVPFSWNGVFNQWIKRHQKPKKG